MRETPQSLPSFMLSATKAQGDSETSQRAHSRAAELMTLCGPLCLVAQGWELEANVF